MNPSTKSVVALAYNRYQSVPFHRSVSEHWDVSAEAAKSNSVWLRPSSNLPFGTVLELQFCQSSPMLAGNSKGSCSTVKLRCFVIRAKMEIHSQHMKRIEMLLWLNAIMLTFHPKIGIMEPNLCLFVLVIERIEIIAHFYFKTKKCKCLLK